MQSDEKFQNKCIEDLDRDVQEFYKITGYLKKTIQVYKY